MNGYSSKWSFVQQEYFKNGFLEFSLPYDFFFSFSTRFEETAPENPINSTYKHFILKVLTPTDWQSADRKKENLLAKAVYVLVAESKGHRGFYFPDSQYDNTFTEQKLEKCLADSHVFVQIVQNVMFRPPRKGKNYCHFEFVRMYDQLESKAQVEHRMIFVIAEKQSSFVQNREVFLEYDSWYQIIKHKDVPYIPAVTVPLDADALYEEIKNLIENKVVAPIESAWDRLIDNVPC